MSRIVSCFILIFFATWTWAQERMVLRVVGDADEPLVGATVSTDSGDFFVADERGEVMIACACDSLGILVQYVGYLDYQRTVRVEGNREIRMTLSDKVMDEVVVSGRSDQQLLQQSSSALSFSIESKSHLPFLLGERDPIKYLQTQAGVSTGTDGNNGYYVRGGGIDQNAIKLDQMEFYNTNHLFGFFSMFSAEAVDRADFMKGGYPAYIGGRLSSTLSMHTVDPDVTKFKGHVGVGLLAAKINLQTPVISNRSGVMLSYRRSYFDLITQNVLPEESEIRRSTDYRFKDLIVKYKHQINAKNSVSVVGFTGGDFNDFQSSRTFSNKIDWQTWNAGLTWNTLLTDKSDLEFYLNGGHFNQSFQATISSFGIDLNSEIRNLKTGFRLFQNIGSHELTYAAQWVNRRFRPSQVDINTGKDSFELDEAEYIYTSEWSGSLDDYWVINDRIRVGVGLRISGFMHWGPFDRYRTQNGEVTDTLTYSRGQVAQYYSGLEPRFRINYLLDAATSLKLSYDRTFQYIHLSPLSSVSLPTDLWVPSTAQVAPQNAHQLSLGYFKMMSNLGLNYSVEMFGKWLNNQMEWRNGTIAGYSNSPNFDDDFIFGKGYSYGVEFSVNHSTAIFKGELNYTLSRTFREFSEVNQGVRFPAKYDRIHDVNLVGSAFLGKWTLSGMFKLASGTALTLPTAKYLIGERVISEYSSRNGFRMPVYHRMDVSATLVPEDHPNVKWVFSVYNIYNRANPYFIYFDVQGSVDNYSLDVDLEEVSLFPVLPSISYQLSF